MTELDAYPRLSVEDVARRLGVHPETVRRMVRRGELRAYRVVGRLRFTQKDVDEFAFARPATETPVIPAPERRPRLTRRPTGPGSVAELDAIEREL